MKAIRLNWRPFLFALLSLFLLIGIAALWLARQAPNPIYPALDKLAALNHSERWSHPELLKIHSLGETGVRHLRAVIRERNSWRTRSLIWLEGKWPNVRNYVRDFPDLSRMNERLAVACQAIRNLGPAARSAIPDLVAAMQTADIGNANSLSMAIHAIGIDAYAVEKILDALERGAPESPRMQLTYMIASAKPPSPRALRYFTHALQDSSPNVQMAAVASLRNFNVSTPEVLAALEHLQVHGGRKSLRLEAISALWALTKDRTNALQRTFSMLSEELADFRSELRPGDSGGQLIQEGELMAMKVADLWAGMNLEGADRERALSLLQEFCDKSGRIFVRMLLLPQMMNLGFSLDDGQAVCLQGLGTPEIYYRIQAARLLVDLNQRGPLDRVDLESLMSESSDIGVRVYGAKMHWKKQQKSEAVLPILVDALDRRKYESYYYPEIQRVACETLGEMGSAAQPASSALESVSHDPNPEVARLAAESLMKIKAQPPIRAPSGDR